MTNPQMFTIDQIVSALGITCSATMTLLTSYHSNITMTGIKKLDGRGSHINSAVHEEADDLVRLRQKIFIGKHEETPIILIDESVKREHPEVKTGPTDVQGIFIIITDKKNAKLTVGKEYDPNENRTDFNKWDV